jgi:hypothetical protein
VLRQASGNGEDVRVKDDVLQVAGRQSAV